MGKGMRGGGGGQRSGFAVCAGVRVGVGLRDSKEVKVWDINSGVRRRSVLRVAMMAGVLCLAAGSTRAQSTLDKLHAITPLGPGFARTSSSPNIHLNNRGYVAWPERDRFGESYLWVPDSPNGTTGGTRFLQMIVTDLNDHGQLVATRLGFQS